MDRRTAKAARWRISYFFFHHGMETRIMGTVFVHAATSTVAMRKALKLLAKTHLNVDQVWAEPRS